MTDAPLPLGAEIRRSPLERQASAVLRERILSGEFRPGHRLVETWLAEQLGLSRGTVRAALSELVHEGLVEQVAYTRWVVPALSPQDAWELYTLRGVMEGLGARLAAVRILPEGVARIEAAFEAMKVAAAHQERATLTDADAGLHKLIIELADHHRLMRQYTILERQTRRYIACSNALTVDAAEILDQHRPIVEALLRRDPDTAEDAAKRHNLEEGEILVAALKAMEADATPIRGDRAAAFRAVTPS